MVNVLRQDLKQLHYTGTPLIRKAMKVDAQFQCPKHFQMIMSPKKCPLNIISCIPHFKHSNPYVEVYNLPFSSVQKL